MLYLDDNTISTLGINWYRVLNVLQHATKSIYDRDFAQPIKPYLRYKNLENRIIGMPGYLGGKFNYAGIKWIASFPENLGKGKKRAHSVTILNEGDTGIPVCIVNNSEISAIRTAGVTALLLDFLFKHRKEQKLNFGIIGFGPIGRMHLKMITELFKSKINIINVYDIKPIHLPRNYKHVKKKIIISKTWKEAYRNADVFITCTVSRERYIDHPPKKGSFQMNISLRDYKPEVKKYMDVIVVDNWEEVCRENTDIEIMHKCHGLKKSNVIALPNLLNDTDNQNFGLEDVIMFNPMGMSVYDIAVASLYYEMALDLSQGITLP